MPTTFKTSNYGSYRVANAALVGFGVWVGTNALPDLTQNPTQFGNALPVSVPITPPVMGTNTLYAITRKRNAYGLWSENQYPTVFIINSLGQLVLPTIPSPVNVQAIAVPGDVIRLFAVYGTKDTDKYPATKWKVWLNTSPPDVSVDPPLGIAEVNSSSIQFNLSKYGSPTNPITPGTYYFALVLFRDEDGQESSPVTGTIVYPSAPSDPGDVHGAYTVDF